MGLPHWPAALHFSCVPLVQRVASGARAGAGAAGAEIRAGGLVHPGAAGAVLGDDAAALAAVWRTGTGADAVAAHLRAGGAAHPFSVGAAGKGHVHVAALVAGRADAAAAIVAADVRARLGRAPLSVGAAGLEGAG